MTSNTKKLDVIYRIEHVIPLSLKDYGEMLYFHKINTSNWMDNFYTQIREVSIINLDKDSVLELFSQLYYAKGEYQPYLIIKPTDKGFDVTPSKEYNPKSGNPVIKVIRKEPYAYSEFDKIILNAIRNIEGRRKKNKNLSDLIKTWIPT